MTDWRQILIELRAKYKPLAQIAREVDMSGDRLRRITQKGAKNMLYENGKKIMDLHDIHCKGAR
jgi:uncharacterized protein YlaN (UPF0358 family)